MKNYKTFLLILVCIAMLCIVACGNNESGEGNKPSQPTATAAQIRTPDPSVATAVPTEAPTPTVAPDPTEVPTPKPTIEPGKHTYADGILNDNQLDLYYCDKNAENGVIQIQDSLAIQIFPTTEFKALYISCPSLNDNKGTLIFEIFQWMGSYESTLKGTPIFEQTFEDYADNALIMLQGEQPFVDGEYIIYISTPDPENGVGVWTKLSDFAGQRVYVDDEIVEGVNVSVQIRYVNTPNNHFGPLSD